MERGPKGLVSLHRSKHPANYSELTLLIFSSLPAVLAVFVVSALILLQRSIGRFCRVRAWSDSSTGALLALRRLVEFGRLQSEAQCFFPVRLVCTEVPRGFTRLFFAKISAQVCKNLRVGLLADITWVRCNAAPPRRMILLFDASLLPIHSPQHHVQRGLTSARCAARGCRVGKTDLHTSHTAQPRVKTAKSSHAAPTYVSKSTPSRTCPQISPVSLMAPGASRHLVTRPGVF